MNSTPKTKQKSLENFMMLEFELIFPNKNLGNENKPNESEQCVLTRLPQTNRTNWYTIKKSNMKGFQIYPPPSTPPEPAPPDHCGTSSMMRQYKSNLVSASQSSLDDITCKLNQITFNFIIVLLFSLFFFHLAPKSQLGRKETKITTTFGLIVFVCFVFG